MKRCLFNLLAAASLVMCVPLAVVCIKGPGFAVCRLGPLAILLHLGWISVARVEESGGWSGYGFLYSVNYDTLLSFPVWLAPIFLVLPAVWLRFYALRHRRDVRLRAGHCLTCGYNLTGNVSGVCPECGTAVQPAAGGGRRAAKGAGK